MRQNIHSQSAMIRRGLTGEKRTMTAQNDDFMDGYLDGRNPDSPAPSGNRSAAYRHSFDVGRREITDRVMTANAYRMRAEKAKAVDAGK